MNFSNFGHAVKELRLSSGFGSRELSRHIGMTDTYISQVERGSIKKPDYFISLKILHKLSNNIEEISKILDNCGIYPPDNSFSSPIFKKYEYPRNDFLSWMDLETDIVKNCIPLISSALNEFVDRDYSRSKMVIKNLIEFLSSNKETFDFFSNLLSFDYQNLSSDQKENILEYIREKTYKQS